MSSNMPDFSKMTINQLREQLKSRGLPVGGIKLVLVERLTESYLNEDKILNADVNISKDNLDEVLDVSVNEDDVLGPTTPNKKTKVETTLVVKSPEELTEKESGKMDELLANDEKKLGPDALVDPKQKRAERFGLPPSDEEKKQLRAERFGLPVASSATDSAEERKRKRAERFGLNNASKQTSEISRNTDDDKDILRRRAERFGLDLKDNAKKEKSESVGEIDKPSAEVLERRAKRFGISNDKAENDMSLQLEIKKKRRAERFGLTESGFIVDASTIFLVNIIHRRMEEDFGVEFQEVAVLQSIYGDDLIVQRSDTNSKCLNVEMKVQPLQIDECSPASIRVKFVLSSEHSPKVLLLQPRGIDDSNLSILKNKVEEHLMNNLKTEVLYDILQLVQTFIEEAQSTPSAVCPICLGSFSSSVPSLITTCEHFVHKHCFSKYLNYCKDEIQKELNEWPEDMKYKVDQALRCPVCRLELKKSDFAIDVSVGDAPTAPVDEEADFTFDWDGWRNWQRELDIIYERQRCNGGIIDIEMEKKKNLVTEDTIITQRKIELPAVSDTTPCNGKSKASSLSGGKLLEYGGLRGRNFGRSWRNDERRINRSNDYSSSNRWRGEFNRNCGRYNRIAFTGKQTFYNRVNPSSSALVLKTKPTSDAPSVAPTAQSFKTFSDDNVS